MPCHLTGQKTVLLALEMLGIKIQKALHTHLFVTQMWWHCMNTIWNRLIIPDNQSKHEYFHSVLIIYWVWMFFMQRCSLSWFGQCFLWNANECISTNSFKYTLKFIITIWWKHDVLNRGLCIYITPNYFGKSIWNIKCIWA